VNNHHRREEDHEDQQHNTVNKAQPVDEVAQAARSKMKVAIPSAASCPKADCDPSIAFIVITARPNTANA
jgi:hypothetical protein